MGNETAPTKLKKNKNKDGKKDKKGNKVAAGKPVATEAPAAAEGKRGRGRPKGDGTGKVKEAKVTTPAVVEVKHKKKSWMLEKTYNPVTGTRFNPGTSQQLAFDISLAGAKNGKNVKQIREDLAKTRKDAGASRDLDAGYFNLAAACHPEFFQVWNTGEVKVLGTPKPDPAAAQKLAEESKARTKRATEARGAKVTKKPVSSTKSGKSDKKPEGRVVTKK